MPRRQPSPPNIVKTQFELLSRAVKSLFITDPNINTSETGRPGIYLIEYPSTVDFIKEPLKRKAENILNLVTTTREISVEMAIGEDELEVLGDGRTKSCRTPPRKMVEMQIDEIEKAIRVAFIDNKNFQQTTQDGRIRENSYLSMYPSTVSYVERVMKEQAEMILRKIDAISAVCEVMAITDDEITKMESEIASRNPSAAPVAEVLSL